MLGEKVLHVLVLYWVIIYGPVIRRFGTVAWFGSKLSGLVPRGEMKEPVTAARPGQRARWGGRKPVRRGKLGQARSGMELRAACSSNSIQMKEPTFVLGDEALS